jgi:hypothetical protein
MAFFNASLTLVGRGAISASGTVHARGTRDRLPLVAVLLAICSRPLIRDLSE